MDPNTPTEPALTPPPASGDLKPATLEIGVSKAPATEIHSDVQPVKRKIGDYSVIRELGRGGMGVVYLARQESLNRQVALKVIPAGPEASEAELKRFRTEAETAAALSHPNIVSIYEAGQANGVAYVAMEYVSGGTLHDQTYKNPLPPTEAALLVESLARAVQCAHEKGIIHRDIKPSNILLAPRAGPCVDRSGLPWLPKIADFGLAKRLDNPALTASNLVLGTPNYMSPEQAQGHNQRVGVSTDIYALGAVLYEALTGYPPFSGETSFEIIQHVVRTPPVRPSHLRTGIPQSLEAICLKALEKDPQKRFQSAKELADTLAKTFQEKLPATVITPAPSDHASGCLPPPAPPPVQAPFAGRWLLALASGVLIFMLGGFFISRTLSKAKEDILTAKNRIGVLQTERDFFADELVRSQVKEILLECDRFNPKGYHRLSQYQPYFAQEPWRRVIEKNRLAWRFHQLEPVAGTPKVSPNEDDFEALPNGRPKPAVTVIHPQTKVTASLIDGKTLVFLKPGGEIHQHPQQDCPEPVQEIHWSPDAFQPKLFVITRKGHGYFFDLSSNSWQQLDEPHAISTGAFSSDGSLLAVGTLKGTVSLWDVTTNEQITFSQKLTGAIEWLRWNRNETLLTYQSNGSTGLLMVSSPFERGMIPSSVKSTSQRFSWASSGNFYVVQENSLCKYAPLEKEPQIIKDREGIIACVALAPTQYDPESLLLFKNDGNIYQIDPIQNKNLRILPNRLFDQAKTIRQIFLHPKEHLVLIEAESKEKNPTAVFYLMELSQPEAKVRHLKNLSEQNPKTLALDPLQNLAYLSLPSGEIVLWNLDLDERATKLMNKADVNLLAVDSTGKTLAFSTSAGQLGLLDLATKATRWEANHEGAEITVLHWYQQDLISAGTDRTLRIWDGTTGMPLGPTRKHPVIIRQIANHGKLLAVSGDEGSIRVWKLPF